ncbi:MAG: branched-chain amino acid ABC transporter permease [Candidatus Brocadiaceae bacterium]|nr:branched-chain amino acid ABC transporter permease [Candidatus Brocadiaceae bacterium]
MNYILHLLIYLDIYIIITLSLNLLIGYSGLFQLAHAAYYGIGAYTTALLMVRHGWGFIPAVISSIFITGCLSFLVSVPAWRFRKDYFVILSLAVQVTIYSLLYNWIDLTNGPFGITGIPRPSILGYKINTLFKMFSLSTVLTLACGIVVFILLRSPWGRVLNAMRDDELAARGIGKNTRLFKIQVFFISCAMVAIAGSLYATYVSYIDPTSFTLDESILMISMIIVGGTGNFRGPIVGALTLIAIPEILRFLYIPDVIAANIRLLIYGLLIITMVHLRPQGLAGKYRFK